MKARQHPRFLRSSRREAYWRTNAGFEQLEAKILLAADLEMFAADGTDLTVDAAVEPTIPVQLHPGSPDEHGGERAGPVDVDPDLATITYSVGVNFTGSNRSQSGFIPPDTMGAVGPSHVVELINGRFAVYNKLGTFLAGSTLDQFWNAAGVTPVGNFSFDPRIVYDKPSGRWFAASVDNAGGANNFLAAVSDTADPTSTWTGFQIDADADNSHWADYPTMGINQDVVVISANMFGLGSPSPGATTSTLVIPKSDLLAGTPTVAHATLFENTNANNTGFSMQPALDYDNGNLPLPILSSYNKPSGALKTSSIHGTATLPTLNTTGGFISVASRGAPPDIDQPGAKVDIDAGDNRFTGNVVMQHIPGRTNPSLWGVHGVEVSGRAAIEWYEIDSVTNALLQSGTISDASLAFNYPSIAVNNFGHVVIGFSGGDPSTFISTYAVVGETVAGVTTFDPVFQTKAGAADYQRLDGGGRNRWGDYSATVVDPSDERRFWTFQEFVGATDRWDIQITEIVTKPVGGAVDVGVAKTDTPDPVLAGPFTGNLTYVVTANNSGPNGATGVTISDSLTLPAGVTVDSVTASAGGVSGASPNYTWNLGSLISGGNETLTIVLTVDKSAVAGIDVISNTATVAAVNEVDSNSANDSATETTSVANGSLLTGGVLQIVGTDLDDTIGVTDVGAGQYRVRINGADAFYAASAVNKIQVYACAGNDDVTIDTAIPKRAELYGGAENDVLRGGGGNDLVFGDVGDDTLTGGPGDDVLRGKGGNDYLAGNSGDDKLYGNAGRDVLRGGNNNDFLDGGAGNDDLDGGAGNDVVLGGAGNDTVRGGNGRDLLIGGAGVDSVDGEAAPDILVGGATSHDNNDAALMAILAEWTSVNSYALRVSNIRGTTTTGLNNPFFLTALGTVGNDGSLDALTGGASLDWFLNPLGADTITDLAGGETVN